MGVINGLPFPLDSHPPSGDHPHLDALVGQIYDASAPGAKSGDKYMLVRVNGTLSLGTAAVGQYALRWNTEALWDVSVTTASTALPIAGFVPAGINSTNAPTDNDLILMQIAGIVEAANDAGGATTVVGSTYSASPSGGTAGKVRLAVEAAGDFDNHGGLLLRAIDAVAVSLAFTARILGNY